LALLLLLLFQNFESTDAETDHGHQPGTGTKTAQYGLIPATPGTATFAHDLADYFSQQFFCIKHGLTLMEV
jgi:hypothetical protein